MLRNKRILLIISLAVTLFLIPSFCNAAETYTATSATSTGKTVNWKYELDESDNAVNLICTNVSSVSGTVEIPAKLDGHTVVTIGNTKNSWDDGAFEGCSGITGITIPNTVTTIGYRAFYECVGLKSVTIPDSVTKIGEGAFAYNTGLTSVTLGKNLSNIDRYAFQGCTGLKSISIPNGVTTIGGWAFENCTGLKNLTIPNSVTSIGDCTFRYCSGINSLTLSNNLTKISSQAFASCSGLTSVVIPDSVTTIESQYTWGHGAFSDCSNLTKVLIPDSVATIGGGAFSNCDKLTIYGNDDQASKKYAEENEVKFDYIKNWDKASSGSDIAAPIVKDMYIKYSSVMNYWDKTTSTYRVPKNGQVIIVVEFSEEVRGKTAPTLVIKCGVGSNISLTGGTIAGKLITYTYTVKSSDLGQITSVNLNGGDITDLAGNKAELTSKKLDVQYNSNEYVYANGSSTVANQDSNNNTQTTVTLQSISITKAPTRNTYTEGETFNKAGMVITAKYSDNSIKQITNYSVSPSGVLKTTNKKVIITYTENGVTKTVEQKITVTAKATSNNSNSDNKNNNSYKDNTIKDTTIAKDDKLPQTGVTVLSLAVIVLIIVAVISKVIYGKYKDI